MKSFVLATIFFCVTGTDLCEKKTVEIESRACQIGTLNAKMNHEGQESAVQIGIKCHK